ncbi:MAG TPA: DEAD/DEAH box helicase [Actinomycetota bacterium]|nr:DEAD/DEAH box helicase [Actinomycetota bacterium]
MDADGFLRSLEHDLEVDERLVHVERIAAREPDPQPFPDLPDPLPARLRHLGLDGLHPHQATALDHLTAGRNVIVATGTASGKTLVYNLELARRVLTEPHATGLYLFPTKALARDQLRQIRELRLPQLRPAVYDGDTPKQERPLIRRTANLILTNPDMLHASILPNHARWADFLLRLALVVVDEAHVARGVFGSHVAMILRRLRRLVARYGGDPRFVLASATVGNPGELAERLVGVPFEEVREDASPRGEKVFCLWNPPMIDEEEGTRKGAVGEAGFLLSRLVGSGARTIAFGRTRRSAELLADIAKRQTDDVLAERIKAYRAGYLPEERRALERDLAEGRLLGVAATNALELGIDIGSLDAAVLAGYPGTRASLWQQAGRAGRRGSGSIAILVAQDDPLDQYLVTHPDDLFRKPPEAAVVDPTNPYVVGPHLRCAAQEHPLDPEELEVFGDAAPDVVASLLETGGLAERRGKLHNRGEAPHRAVDIRSASSRVVLIVEEATGSLLGTVDEARSHSQVHEGAIYLHQGEQYEVRSLDLGEGVALVHRSSTDVYTQAKRTTDIDVLRVLAESKVAETPMFFGEVRVTTQVTGYQRKLPSGEILDTVLLDLPPQTLVTRAVWWAIPDATIVRAGVPPASLPGAAHAAEHAAIGLLPLVATCDRWDVGGVSTAYHPDTDSCAIFIYDGYPGGAGISERGFVQGERLLRATLEAIRACPCRDGCPSCVQSPKCGNGNEPLDKHRAADLLERILG